MTSSLIKLIQQSIQQQWNQKALSDYQGDSFTYAEVAHIISSIHEMFREYDIKRGDRIALCGEGSARWSIAFMATVTYGAVPVPILTTFTPWQIEGIITHSESRVLFASMSVVRTLDDSKLPLLEHKYIIENLTIPVSLSLNPDDIDYAAESSPEDMAMINYTSGTTGNSKGVVLPYRAFVGNYRGFVEEFGQAMPPGTPHLSILPLAHMYGLTLELICPFIIGCHITFLGRIPSPSVLTTALEEIHPTVVMAVPMVIEKLVKKTITPLIRNTKLERALKWPVVNIFVRYYLRHKLINAFGGHVRYIVTGGAAINPAIAQQLRTLHFPLAEAYGATECAPLITISRQIDGHSGSCGKCVSGMELRIDSSDSANIPGEILARGTNTLLYYYKNPTATAETLDEDGWYHTGDIGTIDAEGYLFIRGRKKNMLLGSNGQNIFPEEIEHFLNTMLLVQESVVVQRKEGQLVAIVHPDYNEARELGLTEENISNIMKLNTTDINELIPAYEQIHHIEINKIEFEKTAKRTIKRYLYK
jgi:long-chain acyl-CoA synthetase